MNIIKVFNKRTKLEKILIPLIVCLVIVFSFLFINGNILINSRLTVKTNTMVKYCGIEPSTFYKGYDEDGRKCIKEAYDKCISSQFTQNNSTNEGDPIPITVIIQPQDNGCFVDLIFDNTKDKFSYEEDRVISVIECKSLDLVDREDTDKPEYSGRPNVEKFLVIKNCLPKDNKSVEERTFII